MFFYEGGESALLAAAGSVIGLGNDLAGSIRVPCMFCGLFGHKPTRGEYSFNLFKPTFDFFNLCFIRMIMLIQ